MSFGPLGLCWPFCGEPGDARSLYIWLRGLLQIWFLQPVVHKLLLSFANFEKNNETILGVSIHLLGLVKLLEVQPSLSKYFYPWVYVIALSSMPAHKDPGGGPWDTGLASPKRLTWEKTGTRAAMPLAIRSIRLTNGRSLYSTRENDKQRNPKTETSTKHFDPDFLSKQIVFYGSTAETTKFVSPLRRGFFSAQQDELNKLPNMLPAAWINGWREAPKTHLSSATAKQGVFLSVGSLAGACGEVNIDIKTVFHIVLYGSFTRFQTINPSNTLCLHFCSSKRLFIPVKHFGISYHLEVCSHVYRQNLRRPRAKDFKGSEMFRSHLPLRPLYKCKKGLGD